MNNINCLVTHKLLSPSYKYCEYKDCIKKPRFNLPKSQCPLYCKIHATPEMVETKFKKCVHGVCNKIPKFALPTENRALFCEIHATRQMVRIDDSTKPSITKKTCAYKNCETRPYFNNKGEKTPMYCKAHKSKKMVHVARNNNNSTVNNINNNIININNNINNNIIINNIVNNIIFHELDFLKNNKLPISKNTSNINKCLLCSNNRMYDPVRNIELYCVEHVHVNRF